MPTDAVIKIITPLGSQNLLFSSMSSNEALSELSVFNIELLSRSDHINLDHILAKRITVSVELPNGDERYFDGFVTQFTQQGNQGSYYRYFARVHPWPWFLTRTANCRIFQEMTVPDIVKKIFSEHKSIADYELALTATYTKHTYCVQYRETDYNFIARLLQQEGIYFYFKHELGKHILVLTDSYSGHATYPDYATLPFIPHDRNMQQAYERIWNWGLEREVQSGQVIIDDFDFTKPSVDLVAASRNKRNSDFSDYEIYDYPGHYNERTAGEQYAQTQLDALQSHYETTHGEGNARGLCCGYLFTLQRHGRKDQNREYLITRTQHYLKDSQYEAGDDADIVFETSFSALTTAQHFRPARTISKPTVQGPQTAIVTGPEGDEIYTDQYGRVKVQFHWDREGQYNENSSCWMRVSHPWAGHKWGMIAIPRIGQEVIVDFLEGNPDNPIITGRVYNAEQMPPYPLPANMTQTGIKTRSSKGASNQNYNELRFEDKKGQEHIFVHAERNLELRSKHDRLEWIGHESHLIVEKDVFEKRNKDHHYTLAGEQNNQVGGTVSLTAGEDWQVKIGQNVALDAGAEIHHKAGANIVVEAGGDIAIKAGANIVIDAGAKLTLRVGGSFITIDAGGVCINGPSVNINSGGSPGNAVSGHGAAPHAPVPPHEAMKSIGGDKSLKPKPQKAKDYSLQAHQFKEASQMGTPFCEKCMK